MLQVYLNVSLHAFIRKVFMLQDDLIFSLFSLPHNMFSPLIYLTIIIIPINLIKFFINLGTLTATLVSFIKSDTKLPFLTLTNHSGNAFLLHHSLALPFLSLPLLLLALPFLPLPLLLLAWLPNTLMHRYLSLSGSIACEADFMFIPEFPPPHDWPEHICKKLISVKCFGMWQGCGLLTKPLLVTLCWHPLLVSLCWHRVQEPLYVWCGHACVTVLVWRNFCDTLYVLLQFNPRVWYATVSSLCLCEESYVSLSCWLWP